ncbi:GGDEF domain-containing protein [Pseudoalteromonas sp. MMG010]|uniref:tetratricopeptide repeat-containing diguanylate cyclase n=1 Tax=Pseudoalteromonas sp. MMG010 TaxID=2822685 RepID=UPI001B39D667|nr:diguanylate cyclase [Pseudoalteromonas sp. MMG010]MBQ4832091.1 GGDEF domain-containing protein [Pseudoalteromonas sp. MMG010]
MNSRTESALNKQLTSLLLWIFIACSLFTSVVFAEQVASLPQPSTDNTFFKGKQYFRQGQYLNAIAEYQKALVYSDHLTLEEHETLADTHHEIAQSFKRLNDFKNAYKHYALSFNYYQHATNTIAKGKALKNMAMSQNKLGQYVTALEYGLQSLEIQKVHSTKSDNAQILLLIAIIYRNIGDYDTSLKYIKQSELLYKEMGDLRHLAEVDNQTGLIYTQLAQYDNARFFYQQTIALPKAFVKPETRAAAFRELASINLLVGNNQSAINMLTQALNIYKELGIKLRITEVKLLFAKTYLENKEFSLATDLFKQTIELAKSLNNKPLHAKALIGLGQIQLNIAPEQSVILLNEALALSVYYDSKKDQIESYFWLKTLEKQRNNYVKTLEYTDKQYSLEKEIRQEEDKANLTREKVILESHKLERDLGLLQEKIKREELEVERKNDEIELVKQANKIAALEISEKRATNTMLTILLVFTITLFFIVFRSFSSTKKQNLQLDYLASRDPLTECYNRRVFFEQLKSDLKDKAKRQHYSLIIIDIDSFKSINDQYGHGVGDQVISATAQIFAKRTDNKYCLARFGGEEFCILLHKTTGQQAAEFAENLRNDVEQHTFLQGLSVTCSFGVTEYSPSMSTQDQFIDRADTALYHSKNKGRNRVTLWDESNKAFVDSPHVKPSPAQDCSK